MGSRWEAAEDEGGGEEDGDLGHEHRGGEDGELGLVEDADGDGDGDAEIFDGEHESEGTGVAFVETGQAGEGVSDDHGDERENYGGEGGGSEVFGEAISIAKDDIAAEEEDGDEGEIFHGAVAFSFEGGEACADEDAEGDGDGEEEEEADEEGGGGDLEGEFFREEESVGPDPEGHGEEGHEGGGDGEGDGERGIGFTDVGVDVREITGGADGDEEDSGVEVGREIGEADEGDGGGDEEEEAEEADEEGFGLSE